jgi:protein-S-isoprenylcysteine O-methyltransferase Ste14
MWYAAWVWVLPPTSLAVATGLVLAGCALRSWAAGYLLKGKRVAVGGPYAYIRNPLYTGSFILGAGFCLALYQSPLPPAVLLFWLICLAVFVGIYAAQGKSEEVDLEIALGKDYTDYRARVPAFLPVRGRVEGLGSQRFSSELYRRNREYRCIVGSLAVLAFLYGRAYVG